MYEPTPHDMTEEGLVREKRGGLVWVEALSGQHCEHCAARGGCHSLGGPNQRLVPANNTIGAEVGDKVLVAMPRSGALGAGFLAYLAPALALIAGALVGQHYGPGWGWDPETAAVVVGVGALVLCWLGIRFISPRLARRPQFTVRVVRVLQRGEADAVEECPSGL